MLPRVPLAALALCWAQPASSMLSTHQIRRASSVAFSAVVRSQTALAKKGRSTRCSSYVPVTLEVLSLATVVPAFTWLVKVSQCLCFAHVFDSSRPARSSSKHTARTCTTASAVDSSSSTATRAAAADSDKVHAVYAQVCDKLREVVRLSGVSAVLGWDEQVRPPSDVLAKDVCIYYMHESFTCYCMHRHCSI
jgi:hypothetical protein